MHHSENKSIRKDYTLNHFDANDTKVIASAKSIENGHSMLPAISIYTQICLKKRSFNNPDIENLNCEHKKKRIKKKEKKKLFPTFGRNYQLFKLSAALWTIVSLWIWWQLFSTRSSSFSKLVAHEFRMSLLSLALWKHITPIGLSIFATNALETTISERCFSASCDNKENGVKKKWYRQSYRSLKLKLSKLLGYMEINAVRNVSQELSKVIGKWNEHTLPLPSAQ